MIIQPFKQYIVICKGVNNQQYRWYLNISPSMNAWKIVNEDIRIGETFKKHLILHIEEVHKNNILFDQEDEFEFWDKPIAESEFKNAIRQSNLGFAVDPIYDQSYRCQICGGIVANDICTECMFDWDS